MRLLSFLWRRHPPPERKNPPIVSAVFIDIPNVVNRRYDPRIIDQFRVAWQTLRELIAKDTAGTLRPFAKAYSSIEPSTEARKQLIAREQEHWRASGYQFQNNPHADIDAVIRRDMREWVKDAVAKYKGSRLRLVLVSGDGGYLTPFIDLTRSYPGKLELYVWSWKEGLNRSFFDYTSRARIRYLDEYPEAFLRNPIAL